MFGDVVHNKMYIGVGGMLWEFISSDLIIQCPSISLFLPFHLIYLVCGLLRLTEFDSHRMQHLPLTYRSYDRTLEADLRPGTYFT